MKILVTDRYVDPAGKPLRGAVTFTPSVRFIDVPGGATVAVHPVVARVWADGTLRASLTATTGSDVNPSGWVWHVREELIGGDSRPVFDIALPYNGPSSVVLRDLAPMPDLIPVVWAPELETLYDGGTP